MKKENIIRLTESEFKNVINNTINEAIKQGKQNINENIAVDIITGLGDFVHTHAPQIFDTVLKFDNQWNGPTGSYDFSDPNILTRANQAVGKILALPIAAGGVIGGSAGVATFVNKYKTQIDKLKSAFLGQFAKNG